MNYERTEIGIIIVSKAHLLLLCRLSSSSGCDTHFSGVLTHPCAGSGVPSRGIPPKPGGQEQAGSEPLEEQTALGPQASAMAQGS